MSNAPDKALKIVYLLTYNKKLEQRTEDPFATCLINVIISRTYVSTCPDVKIGLGYYIKKLLAVVSPSYFCYRLGQVIVYIHTYIL